MKENPNVYCLEDLISKHVKLQNNTNKWFKEGEENGWIYFAALLEFQPLDEDTIKTVLQIIKSEGDEKEKKACLRYV